VASLPSYAPTTFYFRITRLLYTSGVFFYARSEFLRCAQQGFVFVQTKFGQKLGLLEFGTVFRIFLCFRSKALSSGLSHRLCYRLQISSAPLHTKTRTASFVVDLGFALLLFCDKMLVKDASVVHWHVWIR